MVERKAIVLSANYNYVNQATTTIKSIMYYNNNVDIYLINNDIPQDWFFNINRHLHMLNSQIHDKKINLEDFSKLTHTRNYINQLTFGRLLIPKIIKESRVLYLDSDIVVNHDLTKLFNINFHDKSIAVAKDIVGDSFNCGVMMINNKKVKKMPQIVEQFFSYGQNSNLQNADQSILNHFFSTDWLELPLKYNYPIGSDQNATYYPETIPNYLEKMKSVEEPFIIHYSSENKPWNLTSGGRMRDKWWQFNNINWYDLIMRNPLPAVKPQTRLSLFTFTSSDQLNNIGNLINALPGYEFNIAAWTTVSQSLLALLMHPNVHIFPNIATPLIDDIISKSDAYLDINQGPKEEQFINRFIDNGLPVFTFNGVKDPHYSQSNYFIFNDNDWEKMVQSIRKLYQSKE